MYTHKCKVTTLIYVYKEEGISKFKKFIQNKKATYEKDKINEKIEGQQR